MQMHDIIARGARFSIENETKEIARAYLYLLNNYLHVQSFGLIEDVYVDEMFRSSGVGRDLLAAVIARAQFEKCYKLIATSRNDGSRNTVHGWYKRLGFQDYGTEFRMNF